jgi:hypothetical protein
VIETLSPTQTSSEPRFVHQDGREAIIAAFSGKERSDCISSDHQNRGTH